MNPGKEDDRTARRRGPKPERVKIGEEWESALGKAVRKKRPDKGWPKPEDEKEKKEG